MSEKIWTLGALLDWTAKHLASKSVDSPRLDAEVLLAHAAGCKRIDLYGLRFAEEASLEVRDKFKDLIRRRLEGCPVAYLVNRKEFFGLEFKVTPAVLIPRPDTEFVVLEVLKYAKKLEAPKIVDVGTGSGAIAVAVAKHLPGARVTAIDVSPEALAIAQENAVKLGVDSRIQFVQSNLFENVAPSELFDIITSNPPYIATDEIPKLPVGVRQYEPHLALDGGVGGFDVFDRLLHAAPERLANRGVLVFEIGSPQEKEARARIASLSGFELQPTILDGSGHPRVLVAQRTA